MFKITVTPLWHVTQWDSRAPSHHTLTAFLNLNDMFRSILSMGMLIRIIISILLRLIFFLIPKIAMFLKSRQTTFYIRQTKIKMEKFRAPNCFEITTSFWTVSCRITESYGTMSYRYFRKNKLSIWIAGVFRFYQISQNYRANKWL